MSKPGTPTVERHPIGPVTINLPGAFVGYFDGSGVAHDEPYYGDERDYAATLLVNAYRAAPARKAGKGRTYLLQVDDALALCILAEYAAMCIEVNDYGVAVGGEKAAAAKVIDRVLATGHVTTHDRFSFHPKDGTP